jgi:hypothetical protein
MKTFVIFGDIEFLADELYGNTALVHNVQHSGFYSDVDVVETAEQHGGDYLVPHYFDGRIMFMQYHKEK